MRLDKSLSFTLDFAHVKLEGSISAGICVSRNTDRSVTEGAWVGTCSYEGPGTLGTAQEGINAAGSCANIQTRQLLARLVVRRCV